MPRKKQKRRSDGQYEYKATLGKSFDGKLIRKSFYSSVSLADAKRKAEAYKVEHAVAEQLGDRLAETDIAFDTWARRWLRAYKKGTVKANTYLNNYEAPIENHLIPHFGHALLRSIRPIDVRAYFKSLTDQLALDTQKKLRACLFQIFDAAVENDLCVKNPVTKRIQLTSTIQPAEKHTWTQAQYDTALRFAEEQDQLALLVLMKTAITRSELLGITFDDVDVGARILHIRQGVVYAKTDDGWQILSEGLKNKYRHRSLPIDDDLAHRFATQPRVIEYGGNVRRGLPPIQVRPLYVFHNSHGGAFNPANWTHRVFEPFMRALHDAHPDVPVLTPHELRHTRATLWRDAGVDLFTISRMMGHVDTRMERTRYVHDNVEQLREATQIK